MSLRMSLCFVPNLDPIANLATHPLMFGYNTMHHARSEDNPSTSHQCTHDVCMAINRDHTSIQIIHSRFKHQLASTPLMEAIFPSINANK